MVRHASRAAELTCAADHMYIYLYDALLKQRQYERVVSNLETQLTDLGVSGRTTRLSSLLSPKQIISEEVRRAKETITVVVVGDDTAFTKIIQQCGDQPVTFGWVPVGPKTDLAERLGLPYGAPCARVLSRRRVVSIDLAQCNQFFFFDSCHVPLSRVTMSLNGSMSVTAEAQRMECAMWNVPPTDARELPPGYRPSPIDRQMEIVLKPVARRGIFGHTLAPVSIFPFYEVHLRLDKPAAVMLDGHVMKETNMVIRLAEQRLKIILPGSPW